MATARPFAYNPGPQIPGTEQIGNLSIGVPTSGFTSNPQYWNGPDEELGYVIAQSVSGNTQPTPFVGIDASVGFFRSPLLTENSFVEYTNSIFGQSFTDGSSAVIWLNSNGYWTSFVPSITPSPTPTSTNTPTPTNTPTITATPTVTNTPTNTATNTPTSSTTPTPTPSNTIGVTFSQAFTGGTAPSIAIETAWNAFRALLTGTYTSFTWSSTNGNSITVTHPTNVQSLADGLRNATITSVTIDSVNWLVGTGCGTPKIGGVAVEFSNVGSCTASSTYALRPMINNANWGGTNQSTVNAPSQTITLTFF